MEEIRLYKSPWKALKLLLLTIPFVLIAVWILRSGNSSSTDKIVCWFAICFFELGIPLSFFQLLDKRPQIIINEQGIFDRTAYKDFINWNLIDDAYLVKLHQQIFISIVIKEEFRHLFRFKKRRLSLEMGFQEININLGSIKSMDEEKLVEFILAMSTAKPSDKQELINNQKP